MSSSGGPTTPIVRPDETARKQAPGRAGGGALGSATAAALYAARGWGAVCALGAVYALGAVALWAGQLAVLMRRKQREASTAPAAS